MVMDGAAAVAKTRCKLEPKYQSRFLSKRTFVSLVLPLSLSPRTDRTRPTQSPSFWRRRRRRRRSREHLSPRCSRPLSFRAGPQKGRLQIRERENCHRQLLFLPRVNKEMKKNVRKMLWKRWMQACGETQNMSSIVGECGLLPTKATFLMGREVTTFQMKYPLKYHYFS